MILKNIQKYVKNIFKKILKKIAFKSIGLAADNLHFFGYLNLNLILPNNLNFLNFIENINFIPSINIPIGDLNINLGIFTFVSFLSVFKFLVLNTFKLLRPFIKTPKHSIYLFGINLFQIVPARPVITTDEQLSALHLQNGYNFYGGAPMAPTPENIPNKEAVILQRWRNYSERMFNKTLLEYTANKQAREQFDINIPGR